MPPNPSDTSPTQEVGKAGACDVERRHELKCWPPFFEYIRVGVKTFEIRKDDRGFKAGDVLHLREYDPATPGADTADDCYTGRALERTVSYVMPTRRDMGLQPGFVVLSFTQPDLQAEVEKREEVEGELVTAELRAEGLDVMRANLNRQKEAAESRISTAVEDKEEAQRLAIQRGRLIGDVVEELKRKAEEAEQRASTLTGARDPQARAVEEGALAAFGEALDLLRDEGDEKACEHGNTFDCPDCRLEVLELMDEGDEQGGAGG